MENKHATYSPAFHLISWIALIGGIVTYLVGLWNADMQLNEKGYYFAVLVLGLFAAASYQKTVRDKYEAIPTTALYYTTCLVVFVIAVGLLVIGLWNATLLLSEKGFYGLAYFLSLFGAVAVQKNVRDVWDPTRLRVNEVWFDGANGEGPNGSLRLSIRCTRPDSSRLPSRAALNIHTISSSGQRDSSRWLARSACTIRA